MQITKDMLVIDLINIDMDVTLPILEKIGMYCVGCSFSALETIEDAARAHDVDVDDLVSELNEKLNKSNVN